MITYQREAVEGLWVEAMPLLRAHYEEVTSYRDIPLDPDIPGYNAGDASGRIRCYTSRHHGLLVGYAIFFLGHAHYQSTRIAVQDVLFAHPDHRAKVGLGLIGYADRQLKAEGVVVVAQHQKIAHPALGVILEHRGYVHLENLWFKRLDLGDR